MSLQSQRQFSHRPAQAFQHDTFDRWDQDALREAMIRSAKGARQQRVMRGRPSADEEVIRLFREVGEMTCADFAKQSGRRDKAARELLRSYAYKGIIYVTGKRSGIAVYALSEGWK